jgi:hypothetical protein
MRTITNDGIRWTGRAGRSEPGIREFVVGTGGTRKDDLLSGTPPDALANAQDTAFGVLLITMDKASFTWEWRSAEGQPPFTDPQSTASCV